MKPIISVEGLGKKYVIRHEGQTHYRSLREEIFQLPKKLFRRQDNKEEFWALKDVSFDIMPGDRVGIIGRNGAGKSTLLKLLSRITEPSAGRITMRGRVASLLEVGTGFHPELTGRDNVYLNGAILGMSRAEVARKFDEIIDFAGVERFLDTPVKRYSSGMYVRLAFAVAAHLESDILIVDEVLAVGDAEFQRKCLVKMGEVGKEGRTVLFVSHNMFAIKELCYSAIYADHGCLVQKGSCVEVVEKYYKDLSVSQIRDQIEEFPVPERGEIVLHNIRIDKKIDGTREVEISVKFEIKESLYNVEFLFDIIDPETRCHLVRTVLRGQSRYVPGLYLQKIKVQNDFLLNKKYIMLLNYLSSKEVLGYIRGYEFSVSVDNQDTAIVGLDGRICGRSVEQEVVKID